MTKYAYRLSAVLRPPLFEDGVVRGGDSVGPNFHRLCAPSCLGLRRRAGCPCAPPGEWPWPRQYMCAVRPAYCIANSGSHVAKH